MNLQSQDLELVQCIAESGTMTAASKRMHITQSAVSQRLSGLQARLGLNLFERRDGLLQLTRAGDRVLAGNIEGYKFAGPGLFKFVGDY